MDVLREAWRGALPLRIVLAAADVTTLIAPAPYFVMAPLHGYLPWLAEKLKPHFGSALPPGEDAIWFDYRGVPLKWHIPTGVLFDLLTPHPHCGPWHLTVHFRAFPLHLLLPLDSPLTLRWHFFNCLKEAVYVSFGSTKRVMALSQQEQADLWTALVAGDVASYERTSACLRPTPPQEEEEVEGPAGGAHPGTVRRLNRVPIRLYLRGGGAGWEHVGIATRCVDVRKEGGAPPPTLRDVLHKNAPHLFPTRPPPSPTVPLSSSSSSFNSTKLTSLSMMEGGGASAERDGCGDGLEGEGGEEEGGGEGMRETIDSSPGNKGETCIKEEGGSAEGGGEGVVGRVVVQGVELSLDTPLEWMARNMCGPDLFVHVCVVASQT